MENGKIRLPAEAGVLVGEDIYFFSSQYNLLYKVHMPDFTVSAVSHIPCGKAAAFRWFRKMRYWNGKLIFIPSFAEKVWMYDLGSGEWKDIAIRHPEIPLKFWGTVVYQDNAFLFGAKYPAILKINLRDASVSYLKIDCPPEQTKEEAGLFFTDAARKDHAVFSPVSISNHVMRLDLDTLDYEWKQIGSMDNVYCGIDYDADGFWIPSWQHGKIVKWDGASDWEEFELPEEMARRPYQFTAAICHGNRIKFLTIQDGKSLEIVKDGEPENQMLLTEETKKYTHWERYEDGTIVLMQEDASMEVKWKGEWVKGICEMDYEGFNAYFHGRVLQDAFSQSRMTEEMEVFALDEYIDGIAGQQENPHAFPEGNHVGKTIWKVTG